MDNADRLKVKAANNAAAADPMWAYQKLYVGDVVYRDYDGYVMQEGAFSNWNTTKINWLLLFQVLFLTLAIGV